MHLKMTFICEPVRRVACGNKSTGSVKDSVRGTVPRPYCHDHLMAVTSGRSCTPMVCAHWLPRSLPLMYIDQSQGVICPSINLKLQ